MYFIMISNYVKSFFPFYFYGTFSSRYAFTALPGRKRNAAFHYPVNLTFSSTYRPTVSE